MKKILVIDDDRLDRRIITKSGEEGNFRFIEALNGQEGFEKAKANTDLDLIITDVIMPELDGRDLVRKIRADQELKDIPIIIVSSYIKLNQIVDLLENGASRFLPKPINIAILNEYINLLTKNNQEPNSKKYLEPETVFERIGNDHDLYLELLNLFAEDSDQRLEELANSIAKKDFSEIKRNSHSFKSALNNIGANSIAIIAQAIERQSLTGTFGNINELNEQIRNTFPNLKKEIENYIFKYNKVESPEVRVSH